jgi:hypothetical protein
MVFGPVNPRGGLLSAVLHLQEQGGWSKTGVFFELQTAHSTRNRTDASVGKS